jgi:hypothetical protein
MAHKAELRTKVEQRRTELQQALTAAENEGDAAERIDNLRVVLRLVDDATQGGWDTVSEVTAVALTKWLDTTKPLILPREATEAASSTPPQ